MIDNSPGIEDYLKYVTAVLLEKSLEEKENWMFSSFAAVMPVR